MNDPLFLHYTDQKIRQGDQGDVPLTGRYINGLFLGTMALFSSISLGVFLGLCVGVRIERCSGDFLNGYLRWCEKLS